MNKILKLRGQFKQKKRTPAFGPPQLQSGTVVKYEKILKIVSELEICKEYWKDITLLENALVSITYITIVPKSRRITNLLKNIKIVGVKFNEEEKHVITYYVKKNEIDEAIDKLKTIAKTIKEKMNGEISNVHFEIIDSIINFKQYKYSKDDFLKTVRDISNIEDVFVEESEKKITERSIVSIFQTEKDTKQLLKSIGIDLSDDYIRNTTLLLDVPEYEILQKNAPYLIAMEVEDWSKIPEEESYAQNEGEFRKIKKPESEPIIGVIDTPFNKNVYFSEWVESTNYIESIANEEDYKHGTGVSSIIVDGPNLNPFLDDGCGNFRVRHFGVAPFGKYSSFSIMKQIESIVKSNPDIKVWNLSLGSEKEIEKNFVSPEAAILDEIQVNNDVIFVVAGTNIPNKCKDEHMKIGAPADSINSIVVNPVDINGEIASYAREGGVLSFYVKPDVCCFGGDKGLGINVYNAPNTEHIAGGTSYAAPWIARKLGYLIYVLGFSKEEAKAILIDSCEKWNEKYSEEERKKYGHGIVPTKISEIVTTPNDEIKFVISGTSIKYDTYNYQLPVPLSKGKFPFAAKVTMCYFPKCNRNQGVDYTNTEFELKFGRLKEKKKDNSYGIDTINNDFQDEEGKLTTEEKARKEFRKWDNTKCIKEKISTRSRDKKAYENPLWGISVTTKNRLSSTDGENVKFGMVITLKELHGVNRISEFVQMCSYNQWFSEEVDIDNQIEFYNNSDNEIEFDDE